MMNTIFVFCGGTRTFLECFDACFENVISSLCPDLSKVTILFYMKLTDPGPKDHAAHNCFLGKYVNQNFFYEEANQSDILAKIDEYRAKGVEIHETLLFNPEISDTDLMLSVKYRALYDGFNTSDVHFIRALHQAYNFQQSGKRILEIEKKHGVTFNTAVYIRPDIFFTGKSKKLSEYVTDKVILCEGEDSYSNDHFAIIPRGQFNRFFFDRMELYRTNLVKHYTTPEEVFWETIDYRVERIAPYFIKRQYLVEDDRLKKIE